MSVRALPQHSVPTVQRQLQVSRHFALYKRQIAGAVFPCKSLKKSIPICNKKKNRKYVTIILFTREIVRQTRLLLLRLTSIKSSLASTFNRIFHKPLQATFSAKKSYFHIFQPCFPGTKALQATRTDSCQYFKCKHVLDSCRFVTLPNDTFP